MSKSILMAVSLLFTLAMVLAVSFSGSCSDDDDDSGDELVQDSDDDQDDDDDVAPAGACDDFNSNRNLYFGDLHAHTALSFDAYGYEVRLTQADAYDFAKGEQVMLPPLDEKGQGTRPVQLPRPLDFAALTDHIEYYAEVRLCTVPDSDAYDTEICESFREGGSTNVTKFGIRFANPNPSRFEEICEESGVDCENVAGQVWHSVVAEADAAQGDAPSCSFTAFPAYEYTATPYDANMHRNVIFKDANVPKLPPSYFESNTPDKLWEWIADNCSIGNGCDALVIPHNSNWSNGNLFVPDYAGPGIIEHQARAAAFRQRMEPLVEIMQHKGDMECKNGFDNTPYDPLCSFEKIRSEQFRDCGEGTGILGVTSLGCISRWDYIRGVLKQGLVEKRRLGVNPYKLGVIGSSDTHNAIPGMTLEHAYPGHVGNVDKTPEKNLGRGTITHTPITYNPGGLTAIWATENSRDALFDSLRNKEAYSTSGTRIEVRFFGGWDLPKDMCDLDNYSAIGYENGVPMGSDLPEKPAKATAPVFFVHAKADLGPEEYRGTKLQRIQIVKGWIDASGATYEKVFEVAGNPDNGAYVNTDTCMRYGVGFESLCALWTDPEFDPNQEAFYYARVVENPSCRWSQYLCIEFDQGARPGACSDPDVPKVIQERAVTSAIWYER